MTSRATWPALLALVTVGLLAASASGERSQEGTLISSLDGGVSPTALPRLQAAPVTLHLAAALRTEDGSLLPKVKRLELAIAGKGKLDTRGLPVCQLRRLRDTRPREAMSACGPALVGRGRIDAVAAIPRQPGSRVRARLLAFNGRTGGGERAVLVHAYAAQPPISVVVPFAIHRDGGRFQTVMTANLARALGPVARFAGVDLELGRRYEYRGRSHSYLSASCPLPKSNTAGFQTIARATYTLADGRRLQTEIVRGCRVR